MAVVAQPSPPLPPASSGSGLPLTVTLRVVDQPFTIFLFLSLNDQRFVLPASLGRGAGSCDDISSSLLPPKRRKRFKPQDGVRETEACYQLQVRSCEQRTLAGPLRYVLRMSPPFPGPRLRQQHASTNSSVGSCAKVSNDSVLSLEWFTHYQKP